jgi:hypothetical protein
MTRLGGVDKFEATDEKAAHNANNGLLTSKGQSSRHELVSSILELQFCFIPQRHMRLTKKALVAQEPSTLESI